MGLFDFLFGSKNETLEDFKKRDTVILDVRTKKEWDAGHIDGAKHIALQEISAKISEVKKWNKPVITCCLSGARSGQAASILSKNGIEVVNGGGWRSLQKKL
jgi:phage shock protein E